MTRLSDITPLREWTHAGLTCRILASPMGSSLNGYVRLPAEHPSFPKGYDDIEVDVSGGLTYGVDGDGWVGFDTAHAGDIWTEEALREAGVEVSDRARSFMESWNRDAAEPWATRWTLDGMIAEVERLANQFAAISAYAANGADF